MSHSQEPRTLSSEGEFLPPVPDRETPRLVLRWREYLRIRTPTEMRGRLAVDFRNLVRYLEILVTAVARTRMMHSASMLAYTTVLSIFPVLAIVISFSSALLTQENQDRAIAYIQSYLYPSSTDSALSGVVGADAGLTPEQHAQMNELREWVNRATVGFKDRAHGIGLAGFVGMLLAALLFYAALETSLDSLWSNGGVRSPWRTFSTFCTIMILAPILIGVSLAISGLGASESLISRFWGRQSAFVLFLDSVSGAVLVFVPMLMNVLLLMLMYMLVPQARVSPRAALFGAVAASILFEALKAGFFRIVFASTLRAQLVAAAGSVPIFLLWVYFSWCVVLLGNHIAYVTQNFRRLALERYYHPGRMPIDGRVLVALLLLVHSRFDAGKGPTTAQQVEQALGLRAPEAEDAMERLLERGLLMEVAASRVAPARPAAQIRVEEVLLLGCSSDRMPIVMSGRGQTARGMARLEERLHGAVGEFTLQDLMQAPA